MAFKVARWFHSCVLTKVQDDGYQYCTQCGTAHVPPPKKCHHPKMERVTSEYEKQPSEAWLKKMTYVLVCTECGDIIQRDIY